MTHTGTQTCSQTHTVLYDTPCHCEITCLPGLCVHTHTHTHKQATHTHTHTHTPPHTHTQYGYPHPMAPEHSQPCQFHLLYKDSMPSEQSHGHAVTHQHTHDK